MTLQETRKAFLAGAISKADYIERMYVQHDVLFDYADYLPASEIARIEIADRKVVMESRSGVRLICPRYDRRSAPLEAINLMSYEQADEAMLYRLITPRDTVFDIGANIGWYALNIARRFPAAGIHAFEPLPAIYQQLLDNVSLNGLSNIHAHPIGFAAEEQELTFYYNPRYTGATSARNITENAEAQQITCRVTRLDRFIADRGLHVDFIKCDVEGAELFVFQGGMETLAADHPIIFTEMLRKWSAKYEYHPNVIISLLASIGYRCFVVRGGKLITMPAINEQTVETNFFFLHPEAHAEVIANEVRY